VQHPALSFTPVNCVNETWFKKRNKKINRIMILTSKKQRFTLLQKMSSIPLYSTDIDIFVNCIGLTPGGSSTVHSYTQTIHRTAQLTTLVGGLSGIRNQSGETKIKEKTNRVKIITNRIKIITNCVKITLTFSTGPLFSDSAFM
jgi:hypothetical protein